LIGDRLLAAGDRRPGGERRLIGERSLPLRSLLTPRLGDDPLRLFRRSFSGGGDRRRSLRSEDRLFRRGSDDDLALSSLGGCGGWAAM
jgi:hypothetical protein